jgi:adenosylmethionine-8-amino-7-oxononanoate aminotransferase
MGKRYLDGSGGAAISCLGHSYAPVKEAIADQLDKVPFAYSKGYTTAALEDVARLLVLHAPQPLSQCYFVSGGSEAVEAAMMLARQYFLEKGQSTRCRFIARRFSYHGSTLATLALGHSERGKNYEGLAPAPARVAAYYPYRDMEPGESPDDYAHRLAAELEATILREFPDCIAGLVIETVSGGSLGAVVASRTYFKLVREICNRYGILLILDEVMCGLGRTGAYFACEQSGIAPDLVCVAKGLAAGYQPIGCVLISDQIAETIRAGSGEFLHGHSFSGHAVACAAALATQKAILENGLLENVQQRGDQMHEALIDEIGSLPYIGDIRGRGLFWCLELVQDKLTKEPLSPSARVGSKVWSIARDHGLSIYARNSHPTGAVGDLILLAPPFVISPDETTRLVALLKIVVEQALSMPA